MCKVTLDILEEKPSSVLKISRYFRRQKRFESERILEQLEPLIISFLTDLFSEEDYSYQSLYKHYLERYILTSQWLIDYRSPVYFNINIYFFQELFRPLENEKSRTI